MELKVLVDNNTIIDRYFLAEPALCFLVCDGDTKVLFDCGYSSIFIDNAQKMGENLLDINYLVISHGHNDHTGGLLSFIKHLSETKAEGRNFVPPTLIAHPDAFSYKECEGEDIGALIEQRRISKHFNTELSLEPLWLTEKLVFLGEIERTNNFENREPIGQCEHHGTMVADYLKDDSALVYKAVEGLVIITGCSHAGICNIVEYAKKVCGDDRVLDIIGGFHLLDPTIEQTEGTLNYFKTLGVKSIHPCHCTSLQAKIELSAVVKVCDVGVGLIRSYT